MKSETLTAIPPENGASAMSFRTFVLYGGFVLTGIATTLLGPILPDLASRWNLDDSHSGMLFTAQFGGSMLGVLLSSVILTRRGPRTSLVSGYAAIGIGVAALSISSWTAGMCFVGCYGFGLGLVIPTTNWCIAEGNPRHRAASLNKLNLAWGLGAVALPVAAREFIRAGYVSAMLFILALGAFAVSFIFVRALPASRRNQPPLQAAPHGARLTGNEIGALAVFGALFFLYVGTENSFAGWVASLARRVEISSGGWILMPTFFWGALLFGRMVAPLVLRGTEEIPLARIGLLLALFGTVLVLCSRRYYLLAMGTALAGLGLSAVFPITISQFLHRFGQSASRFVGSAFAFGGLGGAALPWLVGFASSRMGSLRPGLSIPVFGVLAMLVIYALPQSRKLDQPGAKLGP